MTSVAVTVIKKQTFSFGLFGLFGFTSLLFIWAFEHGQKAKHLHMRWKDEQKMSMMMTWWPSDSPSALCSGTLRPSWCLTRPFPRNPRRVRHYTLYGQSSLPERVHTVWQAVQKGRGSAGRETEKERERESAFRMQLWTEKGGTHHLAGFLYFNSSFGVVFGFFHIFLGVTHVGLNVVHEPPLCEDNNEYWNRNIKLIPK